MPETQYLKIANQGTVNVITACNSFGVSVKNSANAIGQFGSGMKYAMAQAARLNIKLFIASGDNVYEMDTRPDKLKDEEFDRIILRNIHTNEKHDLPFSTNLGQYDWKDVWNIYREFVCNAMDEGEHRVTVVENIQRCTQETVFYLEYQPLKDIHERQELYFSKDSNEWIKWGSGIVFKKGVRVGKLKGFQVDFQSGDVKISESREMDVASARSEMGRLLRVCEDSKTWEGFFRSNIIELTLVQLYIYAAHKQVISAMRKALKNVFGNYSLCVNDEDIQKDLEAQGFTPFVVPNSWIIPFECFPNYQDTLRIQENFVRPPLESEIEMIAEIKLFAEAFNIKFDGDIKIITDERYQETIQGQAKASENTIYLSLNVLKNKRQLLTTYVHEVGHILSGYGDYNRGFADFFIERMADFILS